MDFSLDEYYKCIENLLKGEGKKNEIFFIYVKGSQNYGLETITSDIDIVAVILPSIYDIAENKNALSKTYSMDSSYFSSIEGNENGLVTLVDIRNYFKGLQQHNSSYLEGLFTPYVKVTPYFMGNYQKLKQLSQPLAKASVGNAIHTLVGMANSSYFSMEKKIENNDIAKANKMLASFFRLSYMISEYLKQRQSYYFDYSKCLYFESQSRRMFLIGIKTENNYLLYPTYEKQVKKIKEKNNNLLKEHFETEEDKQELNKIKEEMDRLLRHLISITVFASMCIK